MKKFLITVLSVVLLLSVLPFGIVASADSTSGRTGDCSWSLNGTVLVISGYGEMKDYSHGEEAPWGRSITEVIIRQGVTSIGDRSFVSCSELTSVIIPDTVTRIGINSFNHCWTLKNITIPKSVTYIGQNAFESTAIKNINIPDGVKTIETATFSGCLSLTSVTIPDSVTSIGEGAFHRCEALESISIPKSVTSIGEGAFRNCVALEEIIVDKNNKAYFSNNGILYNKDKTELICYPSGKDETAFTTPKDVKIIGRYAFYGNKNLEKITVSKGVTSIGDYAFQNTPLETVSFPNSLTSIGSYAFNGCSALCDLYIPVSVTSIGDEAFIGCHLSEVKYGGSKSDREKMTLGSAALPNNINWKYNVESPENAVIAVNNAKADNTPFNFAWLALGACAVLMVVGAVVLVIVIKKRKSKTEA